jgi:hypothetical protein
VVFRGGLVPAGPACAPRRRLAFGARVLLRICSGGKLVRSCRVRRILTIDIVSDASLEMALRWLPIADGVALPASEDVVGYVVDGAASCSDRVVTDVVSGELGG